MKFVDRGMLTFDEINSRNSYLVRVKRSDDKYAYYYLSRAGFEDILTKLSACPLTFSKGKYHFIRLSELGEEKLVKLILSNNRLVTDNHRLAQLSGSYNWSVRRFIKPVEIPMPGLVGDLIPGAFHQWLGEDLLPGAANEAEDLRIYLLHYMQDLNRMVVSFVDYILDRRNNNGSLFGPVGSSITVMITAAVFFAAAEPALYGTPAPYSLEKQSQLLKFSLLSGVMELAMRLFTKNKFGFFTPIALVIKMQQLNTMVVNFMDYMLDRRNNNGSLFGPVGSTITVMITAAVFFAASETALYRTPAPYSLEKQSQLLKFALVAGVMELAMRLHTRNKFGFFTPIAPAIEEALDVMVIERDGVDRAIEPWV